MHEAKSGCAGALWTIHVDLIVVTGKILILGEKDESLYPNHTHKIKKKQRTK